MYNNFFDFYHSRITHIATKNDDDHVLIDGVLKKGTWKTMPNHIHIFLVDGKIEAGPTETIGKRPDDLDWDDVHDEEKNAHPNPNPMREAVTEKYKTQLMGLAQIKRKDQRQSAADKIMRMMAAEDEFHVVFLNPGSDNKPSPALHALTKAFADYGKFPISGSFHNQVTFYKDRISLLHDTAAALPKEARADVKVHINHMTDLVHELLQKGPEHHFGTSTSNASPAVDEPDIASDDTQPFVAVHEPAKSKQPTNKSVRPVQPQVKPAAPKIPQNEPQSSVQPRQSRTTVPVQKAPRAKNLLMMEIESLLRKTFSFIFTTLAWYISKGVRNSEGWDSKMLYKVTKHILSNTNVNERDNFFDVFQKSFGAP